MTPGGLAATLLRNSGDNVDKPYHVVSVNGPKEKPVAVFINSISGDVGVFLANDKRRG